MSNTTPDYAAARREWLERYGDYISQAKTWRVFAFSSLAVSMFFAAGLVYEAQRVKVEPYVVEVDKLGESVRLAQAVQAGSVQQPIVTHVISSWVRQTRERISDANAEKATTLDTYNYITQDSMQSLNTFYAQHDPYKAAEISSVLGSRTISIESSLPLGTPTAKGGTYQVTWTERDFDKSGTVSKTQRWVGNIQYSLVKPDAEGTAQMLNNPFGVYITSFQWQETL